MKKLVNCYLFGIISVLIGVIVMNFGEHLALYPDSEIVFYTGLALSIFGIVGMIIVTIIVNKHEKD